LLHPNTPTKYAGRDWSAVARDYAAKALTVVEIAALYAISRTALYNRARSEGWRTRVAMVDGPKHRRVRRQDFGQRLVNALDRRIADFEARRAEGEASAADAERDARTLNTLVRLYDRLQGAPGKSAGPAASAAAIAATPAAKDIHDPDGLRRELARRLEKLCLGLAY